MFRIPLREFLFLCFLFTIRITLFFFLRIASSLESKVLKYTGSPIASSASFCCSGVSIHHKGATRHFLFQRFQINIELIILNVFSQATRFDCHLKSAQYPVTESFHHIVICKIRKPFVIRTDALLDITVVT